MTLSVYIIAAEPSGDQIGAELMRGLKEHTGGAVQFHGIGGPAMEHEGLASRFDMAELTLIGVFEVLPKAAAVLRRVRETVADIEQTGPDVLLTVDSWGFTGRIHKALGRRRSPIKRVRAVAPQVWAWRPGRAKAIAGWIDHLLTLFAFEPPLFERHGLATTWIGHPAAFSGISDGDGSAFRTRHGIEPDATVLGILPGSRRREVTTLFPVFRAAAARACIEGAVAAVPVVPGLEDIVAPFLAHWPGQVVTVGLDEKADAFAAMDAALAASGTVTLDLALAGVPHLIAYKPNWLTGRVLSLLAITRFANLVNIIADRPVVPEFLMERCTPGPISGALMRVMTDPGVRDAQRQAFQDVAGQLVREGRRPGLWAAEVIESLVGQSARS